MPATNQEPAWRTKPCRFFVAQGTCSKGALCCFAHIDAAGIDHHKIDDNIDEPAIDDQAEQESMGVSLPDQADFEEPVAEKEESSEEKEPFDYHPHFGIYAGFGP